MKRIRPVSESARRRGAFMMVALVCLVLSSMLLTALLHLALNQRRQLEYETQAAQADWLLEAGIERAAQRLKSKSDYKGETWGVSAADLGGRHTGVVVIDVRPPAGESRVRTVNVSAKFPADAVRSVKRSKQIPMQVSQNPSGDK